MVSELSALDPKELVLIAIALMGLVPVLLAYRDRSKWFVAGYVLLVVGAIATNVEALVLGDVLNVVEHGAGLLGSAVAFLVAAYLRRRNVVMADG